MHNIENHIICHRIGVGQKNGVFDARFEETGFIFLEREDQDSKIGSD